MAAKAHRVRAVVRIRPLLPFENKHTCGLLAVPPREGDGKSGRVLRLHAKPSSDGPGADREFRVDAVFAPDVSQQEVFDGCNIKSMVAAVCKGYNATVFVYGQTGSGKTFTMEGLAYEHMAKSRGADGTRPVVRPVFDSDEDRVGIMPRTIHTLFQLVEAATSVTGDAEPRRFRIRVSYVQIYNEQVYDLLNPGHIPAQASAALAKGGKVPGLRIRWTKDEDFYVENLFLCECYNATEALTHLYAGMKRKVMASHSMNASSSRSHCIFQLHVESFAVSRPSEVLLSRFSLVDLAGSERVARTHATGITLKESIAINKSLFVLRNVIKSLAHASGADASDVDADEGPSSAGTGSAHFRDSKLTTLLKHSLGGNSLTLMIACLASSDQYWDENKSTLAYASLSLRISNKLSMNEDPRTRVIRELQHEIALLREELARAHSGGLCARCAGSPVGALLPAGLSAGTEDSSVLSLLRQREERESVLDADNTQLSLENQRLRERVEILEYLLAQSDPREGEETTLSAPSSDQTVALDKAPRAKLRSFSSVDIIPLSTTGKLLGPRLPPIPPPMAGVEDDDVMPAALDAAQAMSELTQLLQARAGLRKQHRR